MRERSTKRLRTGGTALKSDEILALGVILMRPIHS
jgi:hypothetical protein